MLWMSDGTNGKHAHTTLRVEEHERDALRTCKCVAPQCHCTEMGGSRAELGQQLPLVTRFRYDNITCVTMKMRVSATTTGHLHLRDSFNAYGVRRLRVRNEAKI